MNRFQKLLCFLGVCGAVFIGFRVKPAIIHGQTTSACTTTCSVDTSFQKSTVTLAGNAVVTFVAGTYLNQQHLTTICENSTGGWNPSSTINYVGPSLTTAQTVAGTCTDFAMRWNGTTWGAAPVVGTIVPTYISPSVTTATLVAYGTQTVTMTASVTTSQAFMCGVVGGGATTPKLSATATALTNGTLTFYVTNESTLALSGTPAVTAVCKPIN